MTFEDIYLIFYNWLSSSTYTSAYGADIVNELCTLLAIGCILVVVGAVVGLVVFFFRYVSSLGLRR